MSRLSRCLIYLMFAAATSLAKAEAPFAFANTPGQLPKDVMPVEYALHIVPDIAGRTYRGSQTIRIEVVRATSKIMMNALDIEIDSARLRPGRGQADVDLSPPMIDKDRQTLVFTLPKTLAPGHYTIVMAWRGVINSVAQGLYVDPYPTAAGDRLLLATQMEPTHARRLLPCWDEPAFRARFGLSVDLPAGLAAYSNMPIAKSEALAGGLWRTVFATTPKMPTYLLALVAGDLERIAGAIDGTPIGIVTTAGKQGSATYALEASKRLLHYYNDYFGTRYPLPKLDHIAMPGGFEGAMENWGAIVYNETALLVDPKSSPEKSRQRSFGVMAHEMAHQWFGNLVTMAWWDNLWLNEGFAQWMGTKATDRFNPQWHVRRWANKGTEWAMALDARKSTHPIQQPVTSESEASDAFDRITYQKGSAFLRMLETYLGEVSFRAGIRAYMARHQYSNTTSADLWAALSSASGKPVAKIAAEWTTQPGFPMIEVDARCDAGRRHITLRQEQFRLDTDEPSSERLWSVPLQIGVAGVHDGDFTLLQTRMATLMKESCDGVLLVDPGNVGYYRVHYALPLFDALADQLPKLPDGARFKLVADTSAMFKANRASLGGYIKLLRHLGSEPRLALWEQVLGDLKLFDRLSADGPSRALVHRFAVQLIAPRFEQLGWDERVGESVEDRQLRSELAQALSYYGDATVINEGRTRFARFVADPSSLPPSLIDSVVHIAGRHADQAIYDSLKWLAERAVATEDKFRYYRALGDALDPALAAQTLQLARATEVPQIIRNEIVADVAESGHLDAAWAYARKQVDALLADMTLYAGNRYFGDVLETSASTAHADELEAFVTARLPGGALVNARRTGDEIRTRAKLKARMLPELEAALSGR